MCLTNPSDNQNENEEMQARTITKQNMQDLLLSDWWEGKSQR